MNKINLTKKQLTAFFNQHYISTIQAILDFSEITIVQDLKLKRDYVNTIVDLFLNEEFIDNLIQKLNENKIVTKLYDYFIWSNNEIDTKGAIEDFGIKLRNINVSYSDTFQEMLVGSSSLVQRTVFHHWRGNRDYLVLDENIRNILRLIYPKPHDYEFLSVETLQHTKYNYKNEDGVLQFINIIQDMLKDNLVEFGKTNEKPLLKSLNLLKSSTGIDEFYDDKKLNTLATDMLTRSFSYYYWQIKKFEDNEHETLRNFLKLQFDNQLEFFITRIFSTHLKKVRFDFYYTSQNDFFELIKLIVNNLINKEWVSAKNILNYCKYRDINFHLESSYKTSSYYMKSEDDELQGDDYYYEIVFEPMVKACLFYLGALGILELKYDDPISSYKINAKGLPYISSWDGLKYIKLTSLGLYTLGVNKTYEAKKIEKKVSNIKFDEYKPIITVDKTDTITIAKLEPYTDKYEENRYILSYSKVFRDCKSYKHLELKIDGFYKLFDIKLPKIFDSFFDDIKANSNMLKRDLKLITIELKNNKKLLNLFMTNKKLQEITTKASGYKILVSKDNMAKLTKIVKDNGFFIEF